MPDPDKPPFGSTPRQPTTPGKPRPVRTLDDPDFIGAEAALKRAAAKAVARDRAAGLEPITATTGKLPTST